MIWRTTVPPPVRKQSRLPGHQQGEAEFAKAINSSTSPQEPGQHMRVRSETQNVSAAEGLGATHWAEELGPEATPWGEHPPRRQDTEKSRRTGQDPGPMARAGKGLTSHPSVVLPVGQRNQIHRVSGG